MSPNPIPRTHLKPFECLRCKAEADPGEKPGGCGRRHGWFWINAGLDLGESGSGSLICIY